MIQMEFNFEYLIGDEAVVKSSNKEVKVEQRKITITDNGVKTFYTEEYYVKYINKPYYQGLWVKKDDLALANAPDELKRPYEVLSVIIDTYLMKRDFEMVKKYSQMRDELDSNNKRK